MNETINVILEILKYTIPSGIVFATAYFLMKKFLEEQRQLALIQANANKNNATGAVAAVLHTRLQAYERLILFLERIEPNQMIPRVHQPGMSASLFKRELQKTVRNEFEHNLTQQIYVSSNAWNKLMASRNAVDKLIELTSANAGDTATGVQFSTILFEILAKAGVSPTAEAIETLKTEAHQLL